jgi:hypothetical protein
VDLMKAYDSISWDFILHYISCFGAPFQYVNWIRECISSPSYSISLNGSLVGYFHGRKGLRQGDPISPYLFVLAMEILSLLLEENTYGNPSFGFHPKCANLKLNHLCFADDLLIFSATTLNSVRFIKDVMVEFESLSGLRANPAKSNIFCVGITDAEKGKLMNFLQIREGHLPIRYLGVPLISKKLSAADYEVLVSRISDRIDSWLSKHLTFAGRLQLISSVLCSLQVFWTWVFVLPQKIIHLLEQKLNRFLWCGLDVKAKAKVSWEKICP